MTAFLKPPKELTTGREPMFPFCGPKKKLILLGDFTAFELFLAVSFTAKHPLHFFTFFFSFLHFCLLQLTLRYFRLTASNATTAADASVATSFREYHFALMLLAMCRHYPHTLQRQASRNKEQVNHAKKKLEKKTK